MNKIINILMTILLLGSCIFNVVLVSDLNKKTIELIELTNIEPEIIFLDSLVYDTVYIEKTEIVKLPIYNTDTVKQTDTIVAVDSVFVELPIELKQFNDTLDYTAISFDLRGFQCEVEHFQVQNLKYCPTQEKEVKTNRFGIGLQLGIGATKNGFSSYIGLGLNYNLIQF